MLPKPIQKTQTWWSPSYPSRRTPRWRDKHADVWPLLEPNDILVDSMRGRATTWTRIRVNLRHVPEADRPAQEALEVDYDPWHL